MESLCKIRDIYRLINEFESSFHEKFGLGFNEGMLLCSLQKMRWATSGEIATMLGLSASNTSKVIASAEQKELILRTLDVADKRKMHFEITPKGAALIDKIQSQWTEFLDIIEKIEAINQPPY